jgi:hypothetical protein
VSVPCDVPYPREPTGEAPGICFKSSSPPLTGEVVDDVRQLFELEMIESGDDARLRDVKETEEEVSIGDC